MLTNRLLGKLMYSREQEKNVGGALYFKTSQDFLFQNRMAYAYKKGVGYTLMPCKVKCVAVFKARGVFPIIIIDTLSFIPLSKFSMDSCKDNFDAAFCESDTLKTKE